MSIVIFHGTRANPQSNWFPWLAWQLPDVIVPELPTPRGQSLESWFAAAPKLDDVVIGHSCGATFVLHLLESQKVNKAILVAPVMGAIGLPEYDELNREFYGHPFDWGAIRRNAGQIIIIHGDDDPYVPIGHAEKLHQAIGGELVVIPKGGHLNSEASFTRFPQIMDYLQNG